METLLSLKVFKVIHCKIHLMMIDKTVIRKKKEEKESETREKIWEKHVIRRC